MDYRYGSHTVFQIEYHFVWVTKYRYKILVGDVAERVRAMVRQVCETFEIRIISGVVSKDHVHILVSAPPTMAPSEIMRRIKGNTASRLFEEFPHLKKRYWGRHFWARGYFCATVGQMTEEMIKQYLEHQCSHIFAYPGTNRAMSARIRPNKDIRNYSVPLAKGSLGTENPARL